MEIFFSYAEIVVIIWIFLFHGAELNCTLPFYYDDIYISAEKGEMKASSDMISEYPMTTPQITSLDYFCKENKGDIYLLKSTEEVAIFGSTRFYLCLEIHQVTNATYYYYYRTGYDVFAQDFVFALTQPAEEPTLDDVCTVDINPRTFIMFVKKDAYRDGLLTTRCPDDLLAVFLNFNVSSSSGSSLNCPNNTLDVCTNRTMMSFSYNEYNDYSDSCLASNTTQSNSGNYSCLYQTTVGGSSYLALWNQDETVDGTNNYRYSCLAYKKEGDTVFATETPNKCGDTTTATNPEPNGVSLVIWNIGITCPDREPVIPEEPVDLSWLYYFIAGLAVLPILIWLICLFIWIYKKFGCIFMRIKLPKLKKPKPQLKKRLKRKPEPIPEMDASRGETVEPARFTGQIRQAQQFNMSNLFRPKKPVEDFTMLGAMFLEQNPMSLLEAPKIGRIYKDTLDDYMCGGIQRSYTKISLDSGIYEKNNGD